MPPFQRPTPVMMAPALTSTATAMVRVVTWRNIAGLLAVANLPCTHHPPVAQCAHLLGTVMSMGVHPRRDGKPAGDRGESGLFRCPKGKAPEPGKHCDSVAGSESFGAGVLPEEGAVKKAAPKVPNGG